MRYDAARLLTERERTGGVGGSLKTRLKLDPRKDWEEEDFGPHSISCSANRQHGYDSKSMGDFLSPLRNFLKKSVGRPWNDVYSEICAVADGRSMDGNHLRDHARQYVKVRRIGWRYYGWGFYVDDEGLLQYWAYEPPVKPPKPLDHIVWDALTTYDLKKGLWFRSVWAYADPNELKYDLKDHIHKKACEFRNWDPKAKVLVSVRQISRKEINKVLKTKGL